MEKTNEAISITERRLEQVYEQLLKAHNLYSIPILTQYSEIKMSTGLSEVFIKILRVETIILYASLSEAEKGKSYCVWVGDKPTLAMAREIVEISRENDREIERQRAVLRELVYPTPEPVEAEPQSGEEHEGMIGDRKVIIRYL